MSSAARKSSPGERTPARLAGVRLVALTTLLVASVLPAGAAPAVDPARVEEALARGHHAEAESLAMEMYAEAEEGSLDAAGALLLAARAARWTGSIPLDVIPRVLEDVLAIQRARLADDDPRLATTYHELGNTHARRGDEDAAAEAFTEALRRRRTVLAADDPDVARSILGLANARQWQGRLDEADALYREALDLLEAAGAQGRPSLVRAVNAHALLLQRRGAREEAEEGLRHARDLADEVLPPDHLDRALVERNLGVLLADDRPLEAEPHLRTALTIREAALPADDLLVGHAAGALGEVLARVGRVREAAPLLARAIAILARSDADRERVGELHVARVQALVEAGAFDDAEQALEALATWWEREEGEDPERDEARRTRLLALRANRAASMGDYEVARPLYRRVLERRADRLGEESPAFARVLHNHAEVLQRQGDVAAATAARERAVAIQEAQLDGHDLDLARGRVNLAASLLEAGRRDEALARLEQADRSLRRALGPDHPERANLLLLRALARLASGDAVGALDDASRGVDLRTEAFGPDHLEVGWALEILARTQIAAGRDEAALGTAERAGAIARRQLRLAVSTLPERQALRLVGEGRTGRDLLIELALRRPERVDWTERAFEAVVRGRALVLDELIARRREADDAPEQRRALDAARRARVAFAMSGGTTADPERARRLRERHERAEAALARTSESFRRDRAREDLGLRAIRTALPPDEALVSFVEVRREAEERRDLVAFVLRADELSLRHLGTVEEVESAVRAWRTEVRRPIHDLDTPAAELVTDHERAARTLGRLVHDPVAPRLAGARRVWWVPDGTLQLVQPLALVDADGRMLVDASTELALLDAERDLVTDAGPGGEGEGPKTDAGLLAVGDPDFGPDDSAARAPCPDLATLRFAPLPRTLDEVQWLRDRVAGPVTLRTGAAADESTVTALAPRHRQLHLATHGFFLEEACSVGGAATGTRGIGGMVVRDPAADGVRMPARPGPLLRAGLALAGANRRHEVDDPSRDGVLLAEEIVALDLSAVESVVLSACDTGIGEVVDGEGVLGLRRAFRRSGAGSVVMSLWPIRDDDTRAWMELYYAAREKGADPARAVGEASRRILEVRRASGRSTHPFHWAAFVASGRR